MILQKKESLKYVTVLIINILKTSYLIDRTESLDLKKFLRANFRKKKIIYISSLHQSPAQVYSLAPGSKALLW